MLSAACGVSPPPTAPPSPIATNVAEPPRAPGVVPADAHGLYLDADARKFVFLQPLEQRLYAICGNSMLEVTAMGRDDGFDLALAPPPPDSEPSDDPVPATLELLRPAPGEVSWRLGGATPDRSLRQWRDVATRRVAEYQAMSRLARHDDHELNALSELKRLTRLLRERDPDALRAEVANLAPAYVNRHGGVLAYVAEQLHAHLEDLRRVVPPDEITLFESYVKASSRARHGATLWPPSADGFLRQLIERAYATHDRLGVYPGSRVTLNQVDDSRRPRCIDGVVFPAPHEAVARGPVAFAAPEPGKLGTSTFFLAALRITEPGYCGGAISSRPSHAIVDGGFPLQLFFDLNGQVVAAIIDSLYLSQDLELSSLIQMVDEAHERSKKAHQQGAAAQTPGPSETSDLPLRQDFFYPVPHRD